MLRFILLFIISTFSVQAQELPEHLEGILSRSQEYFNYYKLKTAEQIEDDHYDDSEEMLFSQLDQIYIFDLIFSKEEIKVFKVKMVMTLAQTFNESQLEAISRIGRSKILNKKKAARYFEVALEYKNGYLQEHRILQQFSSPVYPYR
jgi:hypothetical protein